MGAPRTLQVVFCGCSACLTLGLWIYTPLRAVRSDLKLVSTHEVGESGGEGLTLAKVVVRHQLDLSGLKRQFMGSNDGVYYVNPGHLLPFTHNFLPSSLSATVIQTR